LKGKDLEGGCGRQKRRDRGGPVRGEKKFTICPEYVTGAICRGLVQPKKSLPGSFATSKKREIIAQD